MAQSIYVTLESLQTETSVPEIKDKDGKVTRKSYGSVRHTLPRKNYPMPEVFDNEEMFVAWAKERGALLHLLQNGISADIIDDRAIFKAPVKGAWSPEIGQTSVDNRKWTIATRPENARTDQEKAISAMSKLSPTELAEIIARMQAGQFEQPK